MLFLPPSRPVVIGYAPNYNGNLAAFSETIDYARLTHVNIAFENPTNDDGDLSFDPQDATLVTKAHAAGVKVLVSIGGGGASGNTELMKRYFWLISPSRRADFVRKVADYVTTHELDGLDVDLEGPSINGDYGLFVRDLGAALKAKGKGKLLTAALSKGYGGDQVPTEALKALDYVSVMAYDATGPWAPDRPGPHSSLEFAKDAAQYWIKRGLPKSKLVLGVPFYGYGFAAGKSDEWSYKRIISTYPDADKVDMIGTTVYYNGAATMRAKGRYIVDQGFAGAMIWSLDSDAPGDKALLNVLDSALRGGSK